jgi:glycosyltransferase involved in cell wall biosynthesis
MKILMIAPVPFFEPRGTPFSILGRVRALSLLGHEVDILTYHVGQDISIPGMTIYRTPSFKFIKEIPVGPSWVKVFLDFFVVFKSLRMLTGNSYGLIHTHEEASIFGTVLAKLFKVPHLYDFHSSIPQALGNFGYDKFPLLIRVFEWIESMVIRSSNALIAISPELANYVRRIDKNVPVVVIENIFESVDTRGVSEESLRKLRGKYSLSDQEKIVLYVGTFEQYQGLDLLIDGLEIVSKRINTVKFLLVGGSSRQIEYFQKITGNKGLSSFFLFTGIRPPEEIPMFINIANVLVSTRVKGQNPPSKIYSYLHSGKPIVATNHISHTQVLNSEIAYLVEPNPEEIAEGIIQMLENPDIGEAMGARACQFFEKNYHNDNFVESTDKILNMAVK